MVRIARLVGLVSVVVSLGSLMVACGGESNGTIDGSQQTADDTEDQDGKADGVSTSVILKSGSVQYQLADAQSTVEISVSLSASPTRTKPLFVSGCMPITIYRQLEDKSWSQTGWQTKCPSADGIVKIVSEGFCSKNLTYSSGSPDPVCTEEGKARSPDCCDGKAVFGHSGDFTDIPAGTYRAEARYKTKCDGIQNYSECRSKQVKVTSNEFVVLAEPLSACETLAKSYLECTHGNTTNIVQNDCMGLLDAEQDTQARICCEEPEPNYAFCSYYYDHR